MLVPVLALSTAAVILSRRIVEFDRPLLEFRATTIWHAFILNAIAQAVVIWVAITMKHLFGTKRRQQLLIVVTTFTTSLITFCVMYMVFGFGGGMLVSPVHKRLVRPLVSDQN